MEDPRRSIFIQPFENAVRTPNKASSSSSSFYEKHRRPALKSSHISSHSGFEDSRVEQDHQSTKNKLIDFEGAPFPGGELLPRRFSVIPSEAKRRSFAQKFKGIFGGSRNKGKVAPAGEHDREIDKNQRESSFSMKNPFPGYQMTEKSQRAAAESPETVDECRSIYGEENQLIQENSLLTNQADYQNILMGGQKNTEEIEPGFADKDVDFLTNHYKQMRSYKHNTAECYLDLSEKDDFEMLGEYQDDFPLFKARKTSRLCFLWGSFICRVITTNILFEVASITVILINSIFLAMERYDGETPSYVDESEDVFLWLYTTEMVLKIAGNGFIFNKGAYLRESWNILDFVIVGSGWLPKVQGNSSGNGGFSLNSLRSLRVLRPLKTITSIHSLKNLIQTVIEAIPTLIEILMVLLFVFSIFAIGGLQLFEGLLNQRCFDPLTGIISSSSPLCGNNDCERGLVCGGTYMNPNWGVTNFDNIFSAFLLVFQIVTLEGWTSILLYLQQTFSEFTIFYFVLLVFVGSFFLLNLTLATIIVKYNEKQAEEAARNAEEKGEDKQKAIREERKKRIMRQKHQLNQVPFSLLKRTNYSRYLELAAVNRSKKQQMKSKRPSTFAKGLLKIKNLKDGIKARLSISVKPENKRASVFSRLSILKPKNNQKELTIQNEASIEGESIINTNQRLIQTPRFPNEINTGKLMPNHSPNVPGALDSRRKPKKGNFLLENLENPNSEMEQSHSKEKLKENFCTDSPETWGDNKGSMFPLVLGSFSQQNKSAQISRGSFALEADSPENQGSKKRPIVSMEFEEESQPSYRSSNESDFIEGIIESNNRQIRRKVKMAKMKKENSKKEKENFSQEENFFETIKNLGKTSKSSKIERTSQMEFSKFQNPSEFHGHHGKHESVSDERNIKKRLVFLEAPEFASEPNFIEILGSKESNPIDFGTIGQQEHTQGRIFEEENQMKSSNDLESPGGGLSSEGKERLSIGAGQPGTSDQKSFFISDSSSKAKHEHKGNVGFRNYGDNNGANRSYQLGIASLEKDGRIKSGKIQNESFVVSDDDFLDEMTSEREDLETNSEEEEGDASRKPKREEPEQKYTKILVESQFQKQLGFIVKKDMKFDEDFDSFWKEKQNEADSLEKKEEKESNQVPETNRNKAEEFPLVISLENRKHRSDLEFFKPQMESQESNKRRKSVVMKKTTLSFVGFGSKKKGKKKTPKSKDQDSLFHEDDPQETALNLLLDTRNEWLKKVVNFKREFDPHPRYQSEHDVLTSFMEKAKKAKDSTKAEEVRRSNLKMVYNFKKVHENKAAKGLELPEADADYSSLGEDASRAPKSPTITSTSWKSGKSFDHSISGQGNMEERNLSENPSVSGSNVSLKHQFIAKKPKVYGVLSLGETSRIHFYELAALKAISSSESLKTESNGKSHNKRLGISTKSRIVDYGFMEAAEKFKELGAHEEAGWVPPHTCNIELLYNAIRDQDLSQRAINHYNWSGNQVSAGLYNSKVKRIFKSLNSQSSDIWEMGPLGLFNGFRRRLVEMMESSPVENFLMICVFLNTIILALDGLIPDDYTSVSDTANNIFTLIFAVELLFKLTGLGPRRYVTDLFNVFDAILVILSVIDYVASDGSSSAFSAFRSFRTFRSLRVLRVTRVLRSLKYMVVIVDVISRTLQDFTYISLLLFLFIFIYSLLGMQLWGGKFDFENKMTRQSYDNFPFAFLSAFQVLSVENWNDLLYLSFRSSTSTFQIILSVAYLISWIFIGNFILLNLFLAILLQGFTSEEVHQQLVEMEDENEELENFNAMLQEQEIKEKESEKAKQNIDLSSVNMEETKKETDPVSSESPGLKKRRKKEKMSLFLENSEESTLSLKSIMSKSTIKKSQRIAALNPFYDVVCSNSLFFLKKDNKFRHRIASMVSHRYFERTIIILILANSVQLVLVTFTDDSNPNAFMNNFEVLFTWTERIFNILFFIEMLMKIIKYGFLICDKSYLRDSWSQLDFFIVCASMLDMIFSNIDIAFIRILRMLRTLRPLRFISHNENMKIVVNSLINSFSAIMNVFLVIFFIWLIFGILGINLMGDKMSYCDNGNSIYGVSNLECCNGASECEDWKTYNWNFDNIFSSLQTLFVLSTLESWPTMMYTALDSNNGDTGPKENANTIACVFYLVFIFIGAFFLVNLFVGVIFMQFNEEQLKEKRKRFKNWSAKQIEWVKLMELIVSAKPKYSLTKPPDNWLLKRIYFLVGSNGFEVVIMSCIILNIGSMGMTYGGEPQWWTEMLDGINLFFTIVFIAEAILKLVGLGPSQYFFNTWNIFDFLIVLASLIDLLLNFFETGFSDFLTIGPQLIRVVRVLRVTRLFKLMKSKKLEQIKKILDTLVYSFPSLLNVLVLLALVYFVYSVLGVFLFKGTSYSTEDYFNEFYNFDNFLNALVLLFRASTGEDWPTFMYILKESHSDYYVLPFFLTYIALTTFIIINLFMLVVVQEFEENFFNSDNVLNTFSTKTDGFRKVWSKFTAPTRGARIKSTHLFRLFQTLPTPYGKSHCKCLDRINLKAVWVEIGFRKVKGEGGDFDDEEINQEVEKMELEERRDVIANKIRELELPVDEDGCIPFGIVLLAANKNAFGNFENLELDAEVPRDIEILGKIIKRETKAKAAILRREINKVVPLCLSERRFG